MFPCLCVESDRLHVSLYLLRLLSLFIKSLCYLKEVSSPPCSPEWIVTAPRKCPRVPAPRKCPPVCTPEPAPRQHTPEPAPRQRPQVPAPAERPQVPAPAERPQVPAPAERPQESALPERTQESMPPVRPQVPDGAPIFPKEIFGGGSRAPAEETEVGAGAAVSEAVPPWPWPPELPAPPWPPELGRGEYCQTCVPHVMCFPSYVYIWLVPVPVVICNYQFPALCR